MCAWLSTSTSMVFGSNGKSAALRASASRSPCTMPQSSRTRFPPTLTRWHEPVTSPAAPWNSISIRTLPAKGRAHYACRGGIAPPRPDDKSVPVEAHAHAQECILHQSRIAIHVQANGDRPLEEVLDDAVRQPVDRSQIRRADGAGLACAGHITAVVPVFARLQRPAVARLGSDIGRQFAVEWRPGGRINQRRIVQERVLDRQAFLDEEVRLACRSGFVAEVPTLESGGVETQDAVRAIGRQGDMADVGKIERGERRLRIQHDALVARVTARKSGAVFLQGDVLAAEDAVIHHIAPE